MSWQPASRVSSGRYKVRIEEPGIQYYSGNFLDGSIIGKAVPLRVPVWIRLETQHYPDSPNHPNLLITLKPGEPYHEDGLRFSFLVLEGGVPLEQRNRGSLLAEPALLGL